MLAPLVFTAPAGLYARFVTLINRLWPSATELL
jgi:hypothetical protein